MSPLFGNKKGLIHLTAFFALTILIAVFSLLCFKSFNALAQSYTDPTLVPGDTLIRATHINELRAAIDAKRVAKDAQTSGPDLGPFPWTDDPVAANTVIKEVHIEELRQALSELYAGPWTDPSFTTLTADSPIRSIHIEELRANLTTVGWVDDGICQGAVENCSNSPDDCYDTPCDTFVRDTFVCGTSCGSAGTCTNNQQCWSQTCGGPTHNLPACTSNYRCNPAPASECDCDDSICNLPYEANCFDDCGCGNTRVNSGEVCDPSSGLTNPCVTAQGYAGTQTCKADCTGWNNCVSTESCGDTIINGPEECDGTNFGSATCITEEMDGGNLSCSGGCNIQTNGCFRCGQAGCESSKGEDCTNCPGDCGPCQLCGNEIKEGTEECDGPDFGGVDCVDRTYHGGTLSCTAGCKYDQSTCYTCSIDGCEAADGENFNNCPQDCPAVCGNDIKEGTEDCDGPDFGGVDCIDRTYHGGTLSCTAGCKYDQSTCYTCSIDGCEAADGEDFFNCPQDCPAVCGNNIKEGADEQCDGIDLNGKNCAHLGFGGGTLACDGGCTWDTTGCIAAPAGSCTACGGQGVGGSCFCDASCSGGSFNDCCSNRCAECPSMPGC